MPKQNVHRCLIVGHILFTLITSLTAQEFDSQEEAEAYEAYLQDLEGVQLHLNKASESKLLDLPGLTPDIAWRITAFRPYHTIQDLQRVPGITPDLLDQIAPYLTLKEHPNWHGQFTTRLTRPTNHPNQVDHLHLTQRAEVQIGNTLTGFMLSDRDPQEPNWADYLTAHLQFNHSLGQLIMGDVRPEIGQGLLHSRQTRSAASLSSIRPRSQNRIANRNGTEFGAIRGLHLTTQLRVFTLQALYGQILWDADITPEGDVQIRRTEQHISETSLSRKNILSERLATLHMSVGTPQNHIGTTFQQTAFSPANPQEIKKRHISINGQAQWHQTTLFGEFAYAHKTQAFVTGLNWQKDDIRLHLLMRRFSPHFSALHGAPIAAYGTPPKNEQGLFFGFTYRPTPRTRFELSLDRHKHLLPERHPLPDQGHRFRLIMRHRVGKKATLQITHSTQKTRYDPSRAENRVTFNWTHRAMRTTSWISRTQVTQSGNGFASGLRLQIGQAHRIALWTTVFNIPNFDARIYDFEPDVWGGGTLQTRTGTGKASGILLAWSTTPFRIATRYSFRKTDASPTPTSSWAIQFELHH
jgi:hypothetical protein